MALQAAAFNLVLSGMNSTLDPRLLPEGQFALGVNIAIRGGLARTRPAFVQEPVAFPIGTFQGAGVWSLESGDTLVFVVDGYLYFYDVDVQTLSCHGHYFSRVAQCSFAQADRFFVIQDGLYAPYIAERRAEDGVIVRCGRDSRVPRGTVMHYVHGRLHVVPDRVPGTDVSGKPYFVSGDIVMPSDPGNCLQFMENQYLAGGGAHGLPSELGYITGMSSLRNAQTGTGAGALVVFARRGLCAFDVSQARADWTSKGIGQVLFFDHGTYSPWSVAAINGDLLYRAPDGQRLVRYTGARASGQGGALSNAPVSYEVGDYFSGESREMLRYVSSTYWNHYVFMTVGGVNNRYFRGLLAWDTAPVGGALGQTERPAYAGLWTGLNVGQVVTALRSGKPTCFVFAEGVRLYALDEDTCQDTGADTAIESILVSRGFNFETPVGAKQLQFVELALSQIQRDTSLTVYCRPVGYRTWHNLGTRTVSPPDGEEQGLVRRLRFGVDYRAAIPGNAQDGELLTTAGAFQVALVWQGCVQIDQCLLVADVRKDAPPEMCDAAPVSGCPEGTALAEPYRYRVRADGAASPTVLGADAVPRGRIMAVQMTPETVTADWPENDSPVLFEWPDTSSGYWVLTPESEILRSLDGLTPDTDEQASNEPDYLWELYPPDTQGQPSVADGVVTRRGVLSPPEQDDAVTLALTLRDSDGGFSYDWVQHVLPLRDRHENLIGIDPEGQALEAPQSPQEEAPVRETGIFEVVPALAAGVTAAVDPTLPVSAAEAEGDYVRTEAPIAVAGALSLDSVYAGDTSLATGQKIGVLSVARAALGAKAAGEHVRVGLFNGTLAGGTLGGDGTLYDLAGAPIEIPVVLTMPSPPTCGLDGAMLPLTVPMALATKAMLQAPVQFLTANVSVVHPRLRLWTPSLVLVEAGDDLAAWFALNAQSTPVSIGRLTATGVEPGIRRGVTVYWETLAATVTLPSGVVMTVQVVPGSGILTDDAPSVELYAQYYLSAAAQPGDIGTVSAVTLSCQIATVESARRAETRLLLNGTVTETGA